MSPARMRGMRGLELGWLDPSTVTPQTCAWDCPGGKPPALRLARCKPAGEIIVARQDATASCVSLDEGGQRQ